MDLVCCDRFYGDARMVDIFISYKREDRDVAEKIAKTFLLRGFQVWWDIELLPGADFVDEIDEIIETAKATIVLWSNKAKTSQYVRAEALKSFKLKSLVPIHIERIDDLPVPFNGLHAHDLTSWNGDPLAIELDGLVKVVEAKTGKSSIYVEQNDEQIETRLKQYDVEADFWKGIVEKKKPTAQDYALYLRRYGEVGQFSHTAERRRLAALRKARSFRSRLVGALILTAAVAAVALNFNSISASALQLLDRKYVCSEAWARLERSTSMQEYERFVSECPGSPNLIQAKARASVLATWASGEQNNEAFIVELLNDLDMYPGLEIKLTDQLRALREQSEPEWATLFGSVDVRDVASLYAFLRQSPPDSYKEQVLARLAKLGAPALQDARETGPESKAGVLVDPAQLEPFSLFRDCANCPEMVAIPAGSFEMGSRSLYKNNPDRSDELPQHPVSIAKPFGIGRYEVTFDEWDACVADGYCQATRDEGFGKGSRPVIYVSWVDIVGDDTATSQSGFIAWLNSKTPDSVVYRLPSEAEWEYAATQAVNIDSGMHNPGAPDEQSICEYANTLDSSVETNLFGSRKSSCNDGYGVMTAPVGSFAPNEFGIYDLIGNVYERVSDCYNPSYNIENRPDNGEPRLSGDCENRKILRGGAYNSAIELNRPQYRYFSQPNVRQNNFGFRVARDIPEAPDFLRQ